MTTHRCSRVTIWGAQPHWHDACHVIPKLVLCRHSCGGDPTRSCVLDRRVWRSNARPVALFPGQSVSWIGREHLIPLDVTAMIADHTCIVCVDRWRLWISVTA